MQRAARASQGDAAASSATPFNLGAFQPAKTARPPLTKRFGDWVTRLLSRGDTYFIARDEVASSLPLQMLIYFNCFFSLAFAIIFWAIFTWKSSVWEPPIQSMIVTPLFFFAWLLIEPIRYTSEGRPQGGTEPPVVS